MGCTSIGACSALWTSTSCCRTHKRPLSLLFLLSLLGGLPPFQRFSHIVLQIFLSLMDEELHGFRPMVLRVCQYRRRCGQFLGKDQGCQIQLVELGFLRSVTLLGNLFKVPGKTLEIVTRCTGCLKGPAGSSPRL